MLVWSELFSSNDTFYIFISLQVFFCSYFPFRTNRIHYFSVKSYPNDYHLFDNQILIVKLLILIIQFYFYTKFIEEYANIIRIDHFNVVHIFFQIIMCGVFQQFGVKLFVVGPDYFSALSLTFQNFISSGESIYAQKII